jgi:hypothetical protein
MPSKEVGHDKKRGLVMPMGVSRSELPGSVRGRWLRKVRCVAGEQLEALSSSSVRQGSREGATAVQPEAEVEE